MRETTLITGGAGFIGTNLADRIASEDGRVIVFDNLSRPGVEENLRWLTERHPGIDVEIADLLDRDRLASVVGEADRIFHFAAQVAVTTSLDEPLTDAASNLQGTLNLLEEARARSTPKPLLFTSTNKVYGGLDDLELSGRRGRYEPVDRPLRARGIGEWRPLSFCTPYGCSKGAADQYVVDYARSYGLPTVVFRMSCVYGTHQFGTEDQGWVAHFLIRAVDGEPITIYGDGKQVRDILFAEDLVEAFLLAGADAPGFAGRAFNIGGGPGNSVSLMEVLSIIGELEGEAPAVEFGPWRQGDQRYYVSDCSEFAAATGWAPAVSPREGIARLHEWLADQRTPAGRSARAAA